MTRLKSEWLADYYTRHGVLLRTRVFGSIGALSRLSVALASTVPSLQLLRAAGLAPQEIDSGCCGMAGSFGYESEHDTISRQIGERVLLPAVVVAMGTSCRQQIADGTTRRARHLAEVLWERLATNAV